MTNRRPIGASASTSKPVAEDDLTRLVKAVARQAALEAFNEFMAALEMPGGHGTAPSPHPQPQEETAPEANPSLDPVGERFLTVAAVAERLDVSEKWVRRKVAKGELPAHRVGKLLRVGERALTAYVAKAGLGKG